jgi:hypothetical protein
VICPLDPFGKHKHTITPQILRHFSSYFYTIGLGQCLVPGFLPCVDQTGPEGAKKIPSSIYEKSCRSHETQNCSQSVVCVGRGVAKLSNAHAFFLGRRENHEHLRVRSIMLIIIILYLQQPLPPPRPDAEVKSHMKKINLSSHFLKYQQLLLALCVFGDTHSRLCARSLLRIYKIKTLQRHRRPLLILRGCARLAENAMSYLKAARWKKIYPKCKYYCAHWRRPI